MRLIIIGCLVLNPYIYIFLFIYRLHMMKVQIFYEGRGWSRANCMLKFAHHYDAQVFDVWRREDASSLRALGALVFWPAMTKIFNLLCWNMRKAHRVSISFTFWRTVWQSYIIMVEYLQTMVVWHIRGKRTSHSR